jgi:hypothetical protein
MARHGKRAVDLSRRGHATRRGRRPRTQTLETVPSPSRPDDSERDDASHPRSSQTGSLRRAPTLLSECTERQQACTAQIPRGWSMDSNQTICAELGRAAGTFRRGANHDHGQESRCVKTKRSSGNQQQGICRGRSEGAAAAPTGPRGNAAPGGCIGPQGRRTLRDSREPADIAQGGQPLDRAKRSQRPGPRQLRARRWKSPRRFRSRTGRRWEKTATITNSLLTFIGYVRSERHQLNARPGLTTRSRRTSSSLNPAALSAGTNAVKSESYARN